MLALQINNSSLDLLPDTALSITIHNPIFDKDHVERVYSYPFKVPATPHNKATLNHLERLDTKASYQLQGELWIQGILFDAGIIKVGECTEKSIELTLQGKALNALLELEKFKINEILETVSIPQTVLPFWEFRALISPEPYIIIIDGVEFSHTPVGNETVESILTELSNLINATYAGSTSFTGSILTITSLEMNEVLIGDGFLLSTQTSPAEAQYQNFIQYFLDLKASPAETHCFPVIYNQDFYAGLNESFQDYFNYYNAGTTLENELEDQPVWKHSFIPLVRFRYIFERILAQLENIEAFSGAWYTSTDIQELILWYNKALDQLQYFRIASGEYKYLNGFVREIDLNTHVPELTAKNFFTAFLSFFNVYFLERGNQLELRKKVDQLNQIPIDWTEKAEPEYNFTRVEQEGFTLDYDRDDNDTANIPGQLEPYIFGNGKATIEVPFSPIYEARRNETNFSWTIPYLKQKGSSDELGLGKNEPTLRLLFDKGLQQDSAGNNYHLATHRNKDYSESTIGTFSLDWQGEEGLYQSNWEGLLSLLEGKPLTKVLRLSITDILQLRHWTNARRQIYHQKGTVTAVVKSLEFKATVKGISFSKVAFIKA